MAEMAYQRIGRGCRKIGCMDCKRIAWDVLSHRRPYRRFVVRANYAQDAALLERKFRRGTFSYGIGRKRG